MLRAQSKFSCRSCVFGSKRVGLRWAPELEQRSLLAWADNLFLAADSWAEAQRRLTELEQQFASLGPRFAEHSLQAHANPTLLGPLRLAFIFRGPGYSLRA